MWNGSGIYRERGVGNLNSIWLMDSTLALENQKWLLH
jgi:hypothetical protein